MGVLDSIKKSVFSTPDEKRNKKVKDALNTGSGSSASALKTSQAATDSTALKGTGSARSAIENTVNRMKEALPDPTKPTAQDLMENALEEAKQKIESGQVQPIGPAKSQPTLRERLSQIVNETKTGINDGTIDLAKVNTKDADSTFMQTVQAYNSEKQAESRSLFENTKPQQPESLGEIRDIGEPEPLKFDTVADSIRDATNQIKEAAGENPNAAIANRDLQGFSGRIGGEEKGAGIGDVSGGGGGLFGNKGSGTFDAGIGSVNPTLGTRTTTVNDAIHAALNPGVVREAGNRIVRANKDGTSPQGLSVGDIVVAKNEQRKIASVNPDGTYKYEKAEGLSRIDQERLSEEDQKRVSNYQKQWREAMANGDTERANTAHALAEEIRGRYGYAGGEFGTGYSRTQAMGPGYEFDKKPGEDVSAVDRVRSLINTINEQPGAGGDLLMSVLTPSRNLTQNLKKIKTERPETQEYIAKQAEIISKAEADMAADANADQYATVNVGAMNPNARASLWTGGNAAQSTPAAAEYNGLIDDQAIANMTDQERRTYNYLYNKEGRKRADDYLEALSYTKLNQLAAQQEAEDLQQFSKDHAVAGTILSSGFNATLSPVAGINNAAQTIQNWAATNLGVGEYKPVDPNSALNRASSYGSDIRSNIAQNIDTGNEKLDSVLRFQYETLGTALDMGASILTTGGLGSKAVTAAMSTGSAQQTWVDSLNRGATQGEAALNAFANGVFEFVSESPAVEGMFKMSKGARPVKDLKSFSKQLLSQMGVEAGGEAYANVTQTAADQAIMGNRSEYELTVQEYMQNGQTEAEARQSAFTDLYIKQTLRAAGMGAVLGGASGAMATGINIRNTGRGRYEGKSVDENGATINLYSPIVRDIVSSAERVNENFGLEKRYTDTIDKINRGDRVGSVELANLKGAVQDQLQKVASDDIENIYKYVGLKNVPNPMSLKLGRFTGTDETGFANRAFTNAWAKKSAQILNEYLMADPVAIDDPTSQVHRDLQEYLDIADTLLYSGYLSDNAQSTGAVRAEINNALNKIPASAAGNNPISEDNDTIYEESIGHEVAPETTEQETATPETAPEVTPEATPEETVEPQSTQERIEEAVAEEPTVEEATERVLAEEEQAEEQSVRTPKGQLEELAPEPTAQPTEPSVTAEDVAAEQQIELPITTEEVAPATTRTPKETVTTVSTPQVTATVTPQAETPTVSTGAVNTVAQPTTPTTAETARTEATRTQEANAEASTKTQSRPKNTIKQGVHISQVEFQPKQVRDAIEAAQNKVAKLNQTFDIVSYNPDTGSVALYKVDDFDGKPEPEITQRVIYRDGKATLQSSHGLIITNKSAFVPDDYTGFDVGEQKRRENYWKDAARRLGITYDSVRIKEKDYFNEKFGDILRQYEEENAGELMTGEQEAAVNTQRYMELIPKNSYVNAEEYKKLVAERSELSSKIDSLWEERKALEEELEKESKPKPEEQWDYADKTEALIGKKPKILTERGQEVQKKISEVSSESREAERRRAEVNDRMLEIKTAQSDRQKAVWNATRHPVKSATRTEYEGFSTTDVGTSFGNEQLELVGQPGSNNVVAEMPPIEYIRRCAYEIFDNATFESTIMGVVQSNVEKYTQMMRDGVKFDLPYLNYKDSGQEGRHRALAAYNLGIETIPVLMIGEPPARVLLSTEKQQEDDDLSLLDELLENGLNEEELSESETDNSVPSDELDAVFEELIAEEWSSVESMLDDSEAEDAIIEKVAEPLMSEMDDLSDEAMLDENTSEEVRGALVQRASTLMKEFADESGVSAPDDLMDLIADAWAGVVTKTKDEAVGQDFDPEKVTLTGAEIKKARNARAAIGKEFSNAPRFKAGYASLLDRVFNIAKFVKQYNIKNPNHPSLRGYAGDMMFEYLTKEYKEKAELDELEEIFVNLMKETTLHYDDHLKEAFGPKEGGRRKKNGDWYGGGYAGFKAVHDNLNRWWTNFSASRGEHIDTLYEELKDLVPGMFDPNIINPQDQFYTVLTKLEELKDKIQSGVTFDETEAYYREGDDALNDYINRMTDLVIKELIPQKENNNGKAKANSGRNKDRSGKVSGEASGKSKGNRGQNKGNVHGSGKTEQLAQEGENGNEITEGQVDISTGRETVSDQSQNQQNNEVSLTPKERAQETARNASAKRRVENEHKTEQFEILQNSNPMRDDIHTGIRSVNDIKTAQEVFGDEDEFIGTPDWTFRDAQFALENGTVTIYSSNAIVDGAFVTPSKMIAQDYAGANRDVNSTVVSLDDVAWIDSNEGQLASISNAAEEFARNELIMPEEPEQNELPARLENRTVSQQDESQGKKREREFIKLLESPETENILSDMEPVSNLTGKEFQKDGSGKLIDRVEKFIIDGGYSTVINPDLGPVIINRKGIKSSLGHGIGSKKAAAFAAIPDVIRNGRIIYTKEFYKNRPYTRHTIAAPITIDGKLYYMGVALNQNVTTNFFLHEVTEKGDASFKTIAARNQDSRHYGDAPPLSENIIPQTETGEQVETAEEETGTKEFQQEQNEPPARMESRTAPTQPTPVQAKELPKSYLAGQQLNIQTQAQEKELEARSQIDPNIIKSVKKNGLRGLINDIQRSFNIRITTAGRMRRGALGFYDPAHQLIHTKLHNALGVAIHELGHHIDNKYNFNDTYDVDNMLRNTPGLSVTLSMAGYRVNEKPFETVAEFLWQYMTNPDGAYHMGEYAIGRDPVSGEEITENFYDYFERRLSKDDLQRIQNIRSRVLAFYGVDVSAAERVRSSIKSRDEVQKEQKKQLVGEDPHPRRTWFLTKFVNFATPFIKLTDNIEAASGEKLSPTDRLDMSLNMASRYGTEVDAMLRRGGAMMRPDGTIDHGHTSFGDIFKSLEQELNDLYKADKITKEQRDDGIEYFEAYLKSKHSMDWENRGLQSVARDLAKDITGNPVDDALGFHQEAIQELENIYGKTFSEHADKLYSWWNNFMNTWAVDTGLVSDEAYKAMRKANPHYIPMKRVMDDGSLGPINKKDPKIFKRAKGSARDTYSPIESMMGIVAQVVKLHHKNQLAWNIARMYDSESKEVRKIMGNHFDELPAAMVKTTMRADGVKEQIRSAVESRLTAAEKVALKTLPSGDWRNAFLDAKLGLNLDDLLGATLTEWNASWDKLGDNKNVILAKDEKTGRTRAFEFKDPNLMEAMTMLDPGSQNLLLKVIGKITRTYSAMLTSKNPFFAVRNAMRDIQHAFIMDGDPKYIIRWGEAVGRAFVDEFKAQHGNTTSDLYTQTKASLGYGSKYYAGRGDIDIADTAEGVLKRSETIINPFREVVRIIETLNGGLEMAPRMAAYKKAYEQALSDGETNENAYRIAADAARNVTVDFGAKGTDIKDVGNIIPFIGVSIAGIKQTQEVFASSDLKTKEGKERVLRALVSQTLPAVLAALMYGVFGDDDTKEEYESISDYLKNNYWQFKSPISGQWYRIPRDREFSAIWATPFQIGLLAALTDGTDEDTAGEFAGYLLNTFLPAHEWAFSAFGQAKHNKSWYGSEIYSTSKYEDFDRANFYYLISDESTSDVAELLAKGISHLPDSFEEKIGGMATPKGLDYLIDQLFGAGGDIVLALTTPTKGVPGLIDMLVAQYRTNPESSNRYVNKVYDIKGDLTAIKKRDGEKMSEFDQMWLDAINKTTKASSGDNPEYFTMGDYNARIREIKEDTNLTFKQRQDMISELRKKEAAIALKMVKDYEAGKEPKFLNYADVRYPDEMKGVYDGTDLSEDKYAETLDKVNRQLNAMDSTSKEAKRFAIATANISSEAKQYFSQRLLEEDYSSYGAEMEQFADAGLDAKAISSFKKDLKDQALTKQEEKIIYVTSSDKYTEEQKNLLLLYDGIQQSTIDTVKEATNYANEHGISAQTWFDFNQQMEAKGIGNEARAKSIMIASSGYSDEEKDALLNMCYTKIKGTNKQNYINASVDAANAGVTPEDFMQMKNAMKGKGKSIAVIKSTADELGFSGEKKKAICRLYNPRIKNWKW